MSMIGQVLFPNRIPSLQDVLNYRGGEQLNTLVDGLPEDSFSSQSDDELVATVVASATMSPLRVDFENATGDAQPTKIDKTGDSDYDMKDGKPVMVDGVTVTKTLPFEGERSLWDLRPNGARLGMPLGKIEGQTLVVGITLPMAKRDEAVDYVDRVLGELPDILDKQAEQIAQHNQALPALVRPLVEARRSSLVQLAELRSRL